MRATRTVRSTAQITTTRVVTTMPPKPLKPAAPIKYPPATAPPIPVTMSMNGPYPLPVSILPAPHPTNTPMKIHANKYIHSSLPGPFEYTRADRACPSDEVDTSSYPTEAAAILSQEGGLHNLVSVVLGQSFKEYCQLV